MSRKPAYPTQPCADCPAIISMYPGRKGDRCRSCSARRMASSPEHREAVSRSTKRRWLDPEASHKLRAGIRVANQRPERREQLRQAGLKAGPDRARYVNTPAGSPARILANKRMVDTKLRWCPREYRPLYSYLRKVKEIPAPEAKAIVLAQVAADQREHQRTGRLPQTDRLGVSA
ncbi:MAG: hypothetical protein J0G94_11510 [Sphingomonadales bacterium]|nr:hypothetical protein [Sphingomonadales bacterium]